ncbi:MAG: monofunctional biosynthetic peptidoglycan transglycosylase, partial [Vreelandella alkaliphila]
MLNRALRRFLGLIWRLIWRGALAFIVLSIALVLLFRFVPPPGSMVMVERKIQSWINSEPIDIQR